MFIDTHCHLDDMKFDGEVGEILSRCRDLRVEKVLIPGANLADLPKARNLAEQFSEVYFGVGIHPCEIEMLDSANLEAMKANAGHKKCLAVGEVGLDYYHKNDEKTKKAQEHAFRAQINLAIETKKPLIIHTRESNDDVVRILKDYEAQLKCVIFHCFGGDMKLVDALKCEVYYGIGGVISFKNARALQESASKLPREALLLETDAPYLAPTPHRGKRNSPEFIPLIASHLAQNLGVSVEKIAEVTTENAIRAFGF